MRLLPVLLLGAASAVISGCALRRELSRDELQTQLSAGFPIEKSAGLWSVRVHDPILRLDGRTNRVGLELAVEAGGLVPKSDGVEFRTFAGRAGVEGRIEYDSATGAFYLRSPDIRRLDFPDLPFEAAVPLRIATEAALRIVLRDRPVYVVDPKRSETEAKMKAHVQRVWVEGDRLVVEYHL